MKVLITGAAGFLGRWFWIHHLDRGDDLTVIDDLSAPSAKEWFSSADRYMQRDLIIRDAAEWFSNSAASYERAYHFAAPVGGRIKIEQDPLFNADSLRLDTAFFRWAITNVDTAVYPSSSAVYGPALQGHSGARALQEGMFHPENPNWFAPDQMYGFTKMAGEVLAFHAEKYGLNTLCLRPFSGYGPGQSLEYPVPSILKRARDREDPLIIWGSGAQRRDFIYVTDIVGATAARLADGIEGYQSMNIGRGYAIPFYEIAKLATEIVGYNPAIASDESKPQGVFNRWSDTGRMSRYYRPVVPIREGLQQVLESL